MANNEPKQFKKIFCFSAIFDFFNPYENYPDEKNVFKESILIAASNQCINA